MQECELLKRLRPLFPGNGGDIVAGIGDDAAIVKFGNRLLLAAVDQLIGGIHYLQLETPAAVAGAKLLKRNLSDIAAMGGKPDWALLTIAANAVTEEWIFEFHRGVAECAEEWGVGIIGGDTGSLPAPGMVATLTILGEVEPDKIALRKNAHPGEKLFVTGELGRSFPTEHHLNFTPRLREADFLAGRYTGCMMDISDGLALDAVRLAEASGVQIALDLQNLPPRDGATVAEMMNDGEDYELLFTVPADKAERLKEEWPFEIKLSEIGEIRPASGELLVDIAGKRLGGEYNGYQHTAAL